MVKWRTVAKLSLALVIVSAFSSNLVSGIETSAVPSTIASPTVGHGSLIAGNKRVAKQVGAPVNGKDNQQAETGFGGGGGFGHGHEHGHGLGHGHGDSKYFQYAHNPAYDEYEFGYRRGNDYHFQERYEKAHQWRFKTKVKWGDKYGNAHGEQYWDYNHADHGHNHGGDGGGGDGHYSEPVPSYEAQSSDKKSSMISKRENQERELQRKAISNESKRTTSTAAKAQDNQAASSRDSRDYSRDSSRDYRQSQIPRPQPNEPAAEVAPMLVLDPKTGQIIDESTGKAYWLKPAN